MKTFWTFLCDFRLRLSIFKALSSTFILLEWDWNWWTNLHAWFKSPNPPLRSLDYVWLSVFPIQTYDFAMILRNFACDQLLFNRIDSFDIILKICIVFAFYWVLFQLAHYLLLYLQTVRKFWVKKYQFLFSCKFMLYKSKLN